MFPHYPPLPVEPNPNPRLSSKKLGCLMLGGWMVFLLVLALIGYLVVLHDRKIINQRRLEQRLDARIQCERNSPPWATAECVTLK